jgi:hypothetical protein
MKKRIKEYDAKRKEKEFLEFSKLLNKKDIEYKRLMKTMPDPDRSNKTTIKKWYEDFVNLLFM